MLGIKLEHLGLPLFALLSDTTLVVRLSRAIAVALAAAQLVFGGLARSKLYLACLALHLPALVIGVERVLAGVQSADLRRQRLLAQLRWQRWHVDAGTNAHL